MILTRCPACQTVFRVRPEHLRARHGEVRCGQCLSAFNALDHLVDNGAAPTEPPSVPARPEAPPESPKSPQASRPRSDTFFVLEEKTPPAAPEPAPPPGTTEPATTAEEPGKTADELAKTTGPLSFAIEPEPRLETGTASRPTRPAADQVPPGEEGTDANRNGARPTDSASGHRASTFESLADRLEFEIPETFLTEAPPPSAPDAERMNHVRYRQRKMEWPEIPRPATHPFPEFVAPAGSRGTRAGEADEGRVAAGEAAEATGAESDIRRRGEAGPRPGAPVRTDDERAGAAAGEPLPPEPPAPPSPPPISPEAVDAPLREAAAEAQAEAAPEPRIGRAPLTADEDELDIDRLDERYGPPRRSGRSRGLWGLGVGLLLGMLAVQAAYLFRDEITRAWPQLRPAFVLACEYLGCTLELPRVAAAIEIETSDLLSDPQRPGSFTLNAVVRNNAPHPQAYPYLELTLTDARDRPVIRRALSPGEWVPADKLEQGFLAGDEISVRLPFEAAEVEAVGYRIYAFYP